tara:strand:- start:380 stop:565 length:186 start_codon:yes stop_codon:yes gene_type:complete
MTNKQMEIKAALNGFRVYENLLDKSATDKDIILYSKWRDEAAAHLNEVMGFGAVNLLSTYN